MESSLYERLGGVDALRAVTEEFEARAGKDLRISQKFAKTDLGRLTKEFVDQLCEASGGPCTYTGRNMKEAHANMDVTNGEFDAFMEVLGDVLHDFKVPMAYQQELASLITPLRGEIVSVNSSQVGTPLPSAFKPAPALVR
jgi:hemoglobin